MGKNSLQNKSLAIKDKKNEIIDLINEVKAFCNDFPSVNFNLNLPSFNNDFDVIEYLMDILSTVLGKKSEEIQREITKWLIDRVEPLEKDIRFNLKTLLKSCYACKINPRIAPWLFVTDPTDPTGNTPGIGINIEISQFDLNCFFKADPRSDVGRTLYDGPYDMNYFLYDVIQDDGTASTWSDPETGKPIAVFTYLDQGFVGSTTGFGDVQDTDLRNGIINMKIVNDYNTPDQSIIDFINDYLNSVVIFKTEKVITQSMDLIFGVLTRKIKMDVFCVERQVEFETALTKLIDCGADDPNNEIDNSFYEFDNKTITDIKKQARDRLKGVKKFKCCYEMESSLDFGTLSDFNDQFVSADTKTQKVEILEKGLGAMASSSSSNLDNDNDNNDAKYGFLEELIRSLKLVLTRMIMSPKTMYLFEMMHYLVVGQVRYRGPKEWIQNIICLIRGILQKLLEELSKFLLILVLRGLKLLIKKYIKYKLEQKIDDFAKERLALLPLPQACGGLSQALSNPAAIGYGLVDMGFDQAENQIVNKNKNQKSG